MPHVSFTPLTGFRIGTDAVRELGMTLPGLQQRGEAIARLPSLACLTLAGMLPEDWMCEVDRLTSRPMMSCKPSWRRGRIWSRNTRPARTNGSERGADLGDETEQHGLVALTNLPGRQW